MRRRRPRRQLRQGRALVFCAGHVSVAVQQHGSVGHGQCRRPCQLPAGCCQEVGGSSVLLHLGCARVPGACTRVAAAAQLAQQRAAAPGALCSTQRGMHTSHPIAAACTAPYTSPPSLPLSLPELWPPVSAAHPACWPGTRAGPGRRAPGCRAASWMPAAQCSWAGAGAPPPPALPPGAGGRSRAPRRRPPGWQPQGEGPRPTRAPPLWHGQGRRHVNETRILHVSTMALVITSQPACLPACARPTRLSPLLGACHTPAPRGRLAP